MSENGVYLAVIAIVHMENDDSPMEKRNTLFSDPYVCHGQATLGTFPVDP